MISFNKILLTLTCSALLNSSLFANKSYEITLVQEQTNPTQKGSIEFAAQRGSLGNESIENSIIFAVSFADQTFPGWREYETAESVGEYKTIEYKDNSQTALTTRLFSARGTDNGAAATWNLGTSYAFQNLLDGWTVCISVTKGAYEGKITFTFKPLRPIGMFAIVNCVQEFTPHNLIIAGPEEDNENAPEAASEEASYDETEESQSEVD